MTMNWFHRRLCGSKMWADGVREKLLPWALEDVALGERSLEIGPGYGANLAVLVEQVPELTAVEIDEDLAGRLRSRYGDRAEIVQGDGAALSLPSGTFDSVVCFTMLHHVPTVELQDRLFGEAFRVLKPGGVFAGCDGVHSLPFRVIHIGDTYNPVPHGEFADRLGAAGFSDVRVEMGMRGSDQRFRGWKP